MRTMRAPGAAVEAQVGYAGREGRGVAYARLAGPIAPKLMRVAFRSGNPGAGERATAYAALTAIGQALAQRGCRNVRFVVGDAEFAQEFTSGRGVDERLALPYVRLRCLLNSLKKFAVRVGSVEDLTQRARAEVALNVAA
ncbi:MAG TPA: hypothetical protein VHT92_02910 [Candidatus Cybelea sp.]|nr:hypothetical protein [Candidatus Cybelea sp.]